MSEEMLMDAEKGKKEKGSFDELSNAVIGAAIERAGVPIPERSA